MPGNLLTTGHKLGGFPTPGRCFQTYLPQLPLGSFFFFFLLWLQLDASHATGQGVHFGLDVYPERT